MHIYVAIDQLKGPISYFKEYRENGFTYAMNSSKKIASKMKIEPCELEYILFVKSPLKFLILKINLNHQYHNKHHGYKYPKKD